MIINTTPTEFPDYIICFLLECLLEYENSNFFPLKNEEFKKIIELVQSKAIKSHLMRYFLKLDSNKRSKYKRFKKIFSEKLDTAEIFRITQKDEENRDIDFDDKQDIQEPIIKYTDVANPTNIIKRAIKKTVQSLVNKEDPNPKKLEILTEKIINELKEEEKWIWTKK